MAMRRPGLPGELSSSGNVLRAPCHEQSISTAKSGRVPDSDFWNNAVATEARGLMAQLGGIGWDFADIAAALECGRTTLYSWRTGEASMPAAKLLHLRALVAENVKRAVGQ
jgi:hypothetical protein